MRHRGQRITLFEAVLVTLSLVIALLVYGNDREFQFFVGPVGLDLHWRPPPV